MTEEIIFMSIIRGILSLGTGIAEGLQDSEIYKSIRDTLKFFYVFKSYRNVILFIIRCKFPSFAGLSQFA
jgi:hypothetical protein